MSISRLTTCPVRFSFFYDSRGNYNGYAPLHFAAWKGHTSAVQALVDAKADITIRNSSNLTALDVANKRGKTEAANLLLATERALHLVKAVLANDYRAMKGLIEANAPITGLIGDGSDETVLSYALKSGYTPTLRVLADTDDVNGNTAVSMAGPAMWQRCSS